MAQEPLWRRYLRFTRPDPVADVQDEIEFHLQELERGYREQGMAPDQARRAARDQFGDAEGLRRALASRSRHHQRRAERTEWLLRLREDLRLGLRRLIRQPVFTLTAVATLALGIGATAAVFSVLNAALLRPLPYPDAGRIIDITELYRGRPFAVSPPNFVDLRAQATSFRAMAAYNSYSRTLTGAGDPLPVSSAAVTGDFFDVMGVHPARGRSFSSDELVSGQTDVAILSDGLWRTVLGGRDDVIGKPIQLEGKTRLVVGIMPPGFDFPDGSRVWTPLAFSDDELRTQRGAHYLAVLGRLKDGAEAPAAMEEIRVLYDRLKQAYPGSNSNYEGAAIPLRNSLIGESPRRALLVLMIAVALVTLIACVNVANLLLARGERRQREMAVRSSLGARPRDLIGAALTESVILAVLGGIAGIAVAWAATRALAALQPAALQAFGDVRIDWVVLAFSLGLSIVTGLLFGLTPALQAVRSGSAEGVLRAEGRGNTTGREGWRTRSLLVAAELTLAVMLLAGSGLLIRSFARLQSVDPGFTTSGLLTFQLSLPDARYPKEAEARRFVDDLRARVIALPGVGAVEAITGLPLDDYGYSMSTATLDGVAIDAATQPSTQVRIVTPGLFSAMGIRLLKGRAFTDTDRPETPGVVVLSESAARLLFPGADPIGHHMEISSGFGLGRGRAGGEIIGIVADVRDQALGVPPRPMTYLLHAQWPVSGLAIVIQSANPTTLAPSVRAALRSLDPLLPFSSVRTMDRVASQSVAQPRFTMLLLATFAAVALALAAIGIFGVMSYIVEQRTREIGVRLALGAIGPTVVAETVRRALVPVSIGIVAGLAGALALARGMAGLLFEVGPADPATFAAVGMGLGAIAMVSAWLPARRASRVDPAIALRAE